MKDNVRECYLYVRRFSSDQKLGGRHRTVCGFGALGLRAKRDGAEGIGGKRKGRDGRQLGAPFPLLPVHTSGRCPPLCVHVELSLPAGSSSLEGRSPVANILPRTRYQLELELRYSKHRSSPCPFFPPLGTLCRNSKNPNSTLDCWREAEDFKAAVAKLESVRPRPFFPFNPTAEGETDPDLFVGVRVLFDYQTALRLDPAVIGHNGVEEVRRRGGRCREVEIAQTAQTGRGCDKSGVDTEEDRLMNMCGFPFQS